MRKELKEALSVILHSLPDAYAFLYGHSRDCAVNGTVFFYSLWDGTLMVADVTGLPANDAVCNGQMFGFHIHEGSRCSGDPEDPFADTKGHFNPLDCRHPYHAGDLPPLMGARGYALSIFYTDRFYPEEIIGKTVVIHDMPDDFHTQPSGNSGTKIACGEIKENKM
ncbi:superoxide dismutase family protein [Parablautia sp. Marseille-Q6255]|uniref:superoxide dismutase family protein n=1 Tax=Parablautia sp. Marseille-Q6255 TaxID=3039593 RepID=UPI0024BD39B7|nr:superoxide dismutase family protein [Parablautia sp. Marseille-Q6255]